MGKIIAWLLIWAAVASLTLSSCGRKERSRALANDAYVWQRSWNDSLLAALTESASSIQVWRVLAAEANGKADLTTIPVNREALRRQGKPVIAVIRIDGRSGTTRLGDKLAGESAAIASDWRSDGVPVGGIELDYDCARQRLPHYRDFLRLLKGRIPRDLRLSITALPSWMGSSDLPKLLSEVDETVLQVHSVMSPSKGLFDRATAYKWAQAWSEISSVPFRIALPTYWSRVTWNVDGRVDSIESEVARYGTGSTGRELVVAPSEVASMVAELRRAPPRNLTGIAWFRLPTVTDKRAWTSRTWHAVMQGRPLRAALPVVRFTADQSGAKDVYLLNESDMDAELPAQVSISAQGCEFVDAMPPYDLNRQTSGFRFVLKSDDLLLAGQKRLIGWVRCSSENLSAHVLF